MAQFQNAVRFLYNLYVATHGKRSMLSDERGCTTLYVQLTLTMYILFTLKFTIEIARRSPLDRAVPNEQQSCVCDTELKLSFNKTQAADIPCIQLPSQLGLPFLLLTYSASTATAGDRALEHGF